MNKHSLNRFIEKYYLGGNCSSVVIKSDGNKLSTRFITGDKNLLGELTMSDWKFDSAELGVYNTEQLVKLLSVMSENISMDLTKAGDKVVSLKISDSASDVNYMLSDLSVINTPPNLKSIPEFEVKIKVDKSFMQKFVAGKGALADTDNFTVLTGDDGHYAVNYSGLSAFFVEAIKEQQVQIKDQKEQIEELKNTVKELASK